MNHSSTGRPRVVISEAREDEVLSIPPAKFGLIMSSNAETAVS